MSLETVIVKTAILDAFKAETGVSGELAGFRVYDAEERHKRVFFPHIVVYTPVSTLTDRFVGGGRSFQLTCTVELYFTERNTVTVDGITYKRDNATLIFAERAERILEDLIFPATIVEDTVPSTRSVNYVFDAGNSQVFQSTITYVMEYVVS